VAEDVRQWLQRVRLFGLAAWALVALTAAPAGAAPQSVTPLQLRNQFEECGYDVTGSPTGPGTHYLVARDPGAGSVRDTYRIVVAIVYPDAPTASAAHQRVHHAAEQRLGQRWPWSDDHGPQLLSAYGDSVWRGNVALVQSNGRTLASLHTEDVETGETRVARPELLELGFNSSASRYGVDRDFIDCLEGLWPADNLTTQTDASSIPEPIAPIFLPGRPW
jgi:hypothetical protein